MWAAIVAIVVVVVVADVKFASARVDNKNNSNVEWHVHCRRESIVNEYNNNDNYYNAISHDNRMQ